MYSGTLPATLASWIARLVASPSSSAGRVSEWNFGIGLAAGERLGDEHVDGDAVLGVHHDHRPGLAGVLHRPQDLAVVGVEHAGVGHEQLEAGDALVVDEVRHRLQRLLVDAADDLVEAVVDGAVAVGLAVPVGEPSCTFSPVRCTAKSTIVVTPPHAAAIVPVSNVSEASVPPKGSSMCVCTSTPPGTTYLPVASMVRSAVSDRRPPPRSRGLGLPGASTAAIVSPSINVGRRAAVPAGGADDGAARVGLIGPSSGHRQDLHELVVGVGAAVAVERPAVADQLDLVQVEVADDQLGLVGSPTSPTNLPSGSTK